MHTPTKSYNNYQESILKYLKCKAARYILNHLQDKVQPNVFVIVADLTREMGFNRLYFRENASMRHLIWPRIMQISKAFAHQG